jgi:hypothetical protein
MTIEELIKKSKRNLTVNKAFKCESEMDLSIITDFKIKHE